MYKLAPFVRAAVLCAAAASAAACSTNAVGAPAPGAQTATSTMQSPLAAHVAGLRGTIRYGPPALTTHRGGGWMSPAAKTGGILYGSSYDGGFINLYSVKGNNQQVTGQLTDTLVSPQGMVVDRHHQLWVANTNASTIVGFKRGSTSPFTTLNDPGYYPVTVAVGNDGTVYAANVVSLSGPPGNVAVFANGSTNPTATLTYSGFLLVLGLGIDANNNLYVSYQPSSGPAAVVEFPSGSQTAQPVPLSDISEGDITFDRQSDLVMENGSGGLGVWTSPYSGGPARSIPAFGNEPTFDRKENKVWVAYANFSTPKIIGYNYTSGALVDTITNGWSVNGPIPYGVAIDPSAPL